MTQIRLMLPTEIAVLPTFLPTALPTHPTIPDTRQTPILVFRSAPSIFYTRDFHFFTPTPLIRNDLQRLKAFPFQILYIQTKFIRYFYQ